LRRTKGDRAAQNAIRSQALAKFNVLKEISSRGKLKQAIEWIEDFTESEKLVTFCINRSMVEEINNYFKDNSVKLYGGMSNKQKDEAILKFTNDPNVDLFVGNIEACKEGLPLHVADCTLTLQLDWVPSNHEQCDSRVINKEKIHVPITSYYMIAIDTIEETIAAMIDRKEKVPSQLLDREEVEEESLLTALIEKYSNM
jgi:SWI/SNF-related matrix-associated actin-dependent regulator 1 of chromatin subfamily A